MKRPELLERHAALVAYLEEEVARIALVEGGRPRAEMQRLLLLLGVRAYNGGASFRGLSNQREKVKRIAASRARAGDGGGRVLAFVTPTPE